MAIAITHPFVNPKADGADATITRPSDWNATHTLSGLGTGVETALGVNVGSAGAVVINGGALGTPSGGVATNLTGTASGLTAGAVALSGVTGSYTSGGAVYASSTSALSVGALLATNGVVVGGGAGAAPATVAGFTLVGTLLTTPGVITSGVGTKTSPNFQGGSTNTGMYTTSGFTAGLSLNGSSYFDVTNGKVSTVSTNVLGWTSSASDAAAAADAAMYRGGSNQVVFSAGSVNTITSRAEINKNVTTIADNVATATVTVTVPNAAHSAGGKLVIKAAAGAGGAIGADEFSVENEYAWVVTRTAGVNAVATLTAIVTGVAASVAGGAAVTLTAAFSAISGAVGATNTFTLNVTIAHGSGSSTNHTCFVYGTLLNDNASGVTIV